MEQIKRRDFTRTYAALKQYHATQARRDAAWDRAASNAEVERCMANDDIARLVVQDAFYQDTADINQQCNCRRISVQDIARMTGWKG